MKPAVEIAIAALYEHGTLGHVLHVHVAAVVVDVNPTADMTTTVFGACVAVNVGEHTEAKATAVIGAWVRETVDE